jgi:hypothetical protein
MNARDELTSDELRKVRFPERKVRFPEEAHGLRAARRRCRAIGYERDKMEHDDTVEVSHERIRRQSL